MPSVVVLNDLEHDTCAVINSHHRAASSDKHACRGFFRRVDGLKEQKAVNNDNNNYNYNYSVYILLNLHT